MKTKICPKCKDEHPVTATYCGCGYKWTAELQSKHDPNHGQCAWESDGMRCTNPGTITDSTTGSDTWYCSGHAGCTNPTIGHQIMLDALRRNPHPDFSPDARRTRSLRVAENAVPELMRGWTVDEYRQYARTMIKGLIKRTTKVAK